jgi:hypothetical protein
MKSPKKKVRPRLVVVLADIHSGSTMSLIPPGFETHEGNVIRPNAVQLWLWECWLDAQRWVGSVTAGDPYALVLNGDLIEGDHHGTKQIFSKSIGDHVSCAEQVLAPLAAVADHTFIVAGTECHTGTHEETLGKILGSVKNPDTNRHSWDRLSLNIAGTQCVFRHHIGTSTRRGLAATQFSAILAEEQLEAANNKEKLPTVVCCAHRHKFGHWQDENSVVVVSPPWQMLTRFAHKVVSHARTKPGVFILDWRGKPDGSRPEVRSMLYETPIQRGISL